MWECELWQSELGAGDGFAGVLPMPMWECELWQSIRRLRPPRILVLPMWECELWQSCAQRC